MTDEADENDEEHTLIDMPQACEEAEQEEGISWACLKAEFL